MTTTKSRPFAALRYRDFRLLWTGQLISIAGSRMQTAAILWHVYELTDSPLALGGVGLVSIAPILLFSLIAGVVADVLDRRKLMLLTQSSAAVLAALLGALTLFKLDNLWVIYAITFLSSAAWAFDAPARQSLIPSMVSREHLPNAYSLNATVFQLGSIFGPAAAGILIARLGVAAAYGFNALSFLAVIAALLLMRPVQRAESPEAEKREVSLRAALEGLRFIRARPIILSSMLLDFLATFFSSANALLPIFARDILRVGPTGYGWLYASASIGAAATGGLMSLGSNLKRQGPTLLWAVAVYGAATVLFGVSRSFGLSFFALALTGASDTVSMIIRNTIRNLQTPDRLRGRMTSVNMVFFMGGPQLGELEAGAVAALFGAPLSVIAGGLGCLLALAVIAWRAPHLRRYHGEEPELVDEYSPLTAAAD